MSRIPEWARQARAGWRYFGQERPHFAEEPGPGQESVWDYPRPPALLPDTRQVQVRAGGKVIARSNGCYRILETASPPTVYIPPGDIVPGALEPAPGRSACEWKGLSRYWNVVVDGKRFTQAAWSYPDPLPGFEAIRDYVSFYPGRVDCTLDGEPVRPQPGGFYGGWITSEIVGPVKGEPGSSGW